MNIITLAEHSFDLHLLSRGVAIDVGCRGFAFSKEMGYLGCHVVTFDIEDMEAPNGIIFIKAAVGNEVKQGFYVDTEDPQAKYLSDKGVPIRVTTLDIIYETCKEAVPELPIDILKLDCEGSEYLILSDPAFQPIPKQISVEFHMHAHRQLHDQYYDKCMENLLKNYEPVQHELTRAHGAGLNYWDSLFIRKDLI